MSVEKIDGVTVSKDRTLTVFEYPEHYRVRLGCVDDHDLCCKWVDGTFATKRAAISAGRKAARAEGRLVVAVETTEVGS